MKEAKMREIANFTLCKYTIKYNLYGKCQPTTNELDAIRGARKGEKENYSRRRR